VVAFINRATDLFECGTGGADVREGGHVLRQDQGHTGAHIALASRFVEVGGVEGSVRS
jgi:hypothetical protein